MAHPQFVSGTDSLNVMKSMITEKERELAIYRQQIRYVEKSNVTVEVQRNYSTVAIDDADGEGVFLQGCEADEFIDAADALFESTGELSLAEAYKVQAYPYIDTMV